MKKLTVLAFMLAGLLPFLFFSSVHAYPDLSIGQEIKFKDGPGTTAGGEFLVYNSSSSYDGPELFRSFCLETDEFISFGTNFKIAGISTEAKDGGSGGPSPDPISAETAYLYHHFYWKNLTGYDFTGAGRAADADSLQTAIWYLEEEITGNGTVDYENNEFVKLARSAVTSKNWTGLGDVRVINLTYADGRRAQDQLTVAPVPEPATMFLLGTGLLGLAGLGRRLKKK